MSSVPGILEYNKKFVDSKRYEAFASNRLPSKKIAVLSCMDTRLTELLPAALNFKNGEVKLIKNAGAMITHPFGSVMRSLLVAIYELGVREVMVIGHHDCGMQRLDSSVMLKKMIGRGISQDAIDAAQTAGIDVHKWLNGFDNTEASVARTVDIIRKHPFVPADVEVYGFIIDPATGLLSLQKEPHQSSKDSE